MKIYKTINIAGLLSNTNKIQIPIYIPFQPTYMIIKSASFTSLSGVNSVDTVLFLKTSLYNNDIIAHFSREAIKDNIDIWSGMLNTKYQLHSSPINGNYDFFFTNINGEVPDNIEETTIEFALTIEFVQEK